MGARFGGATVDVVSESVTLPEALDDGRLSVPVYPPAAGIGAAVAAEVTVAVPLFVWEGVAVGVGVGVGVAVL
jgi:hypothetical protein